MFTFGKPPATRQAWLESLARRLAWAFPEVQAKDIFADYREQFGEGKNRGKSDNEIIEALGTPSEAVAQLMEEDPSARMDLLRHCLLWGAALVLCWAFVWLSFLGNMRTGFLIGVCMFLPVSSAVLFMLIRGPGRLVLEQLAIPKKPASPGKIFLVLPVLMFLCLISQEILIIRFVRFGDIPLEWNAPQDIGPINVMALELFALAMALLAAWLLFRSVTSSIRYFPGIVHAGGAAFSALAITSVYTAMDIEISHSILELQVLFRLAPYLAGLITARVFQHWVDGSKPLPYCFRDKNVNWTDWRHRLAVSLLGWFSAEQSIEILEDYQEQFELGREQGKPEADILSEMGRPATVVRDLLAEDRKARLRRRKHWPWVVMCVLAGWLLLGLMKAFEFGGVGLGLYFDDHRIQIGILSVVLGTASLFVLLCVHKRAAVERRFPTEKKPTVWLFLLPVVIIVLLNGFTMYLSVCRILSSGAARFFMVVWAERFVVALCVLMVWALARCFSGSIRYLPAAIHAAGCACSVLCTGLLCSHLDPEGMYGQIRYSWFLPDLLPYAVSVVLALAVWLVIHRKPNKEG